MKKIWITGVSLLALSGRVSLAAPDEQDKLTCAAMGYDTTAADCLAKDGNPLLCPFAGVNEESLCLKSESCRGFPLIKENNAYYYFKTETDKTGTYIRLKIKAAPTAQDVESKVDGSMESCSVGNLDGSFTYYRVPKCKAGYRFDNHICIDNCDVNRYPYTYHPGTIRGTVDVCVDGNGEHYGYIACNEGWVPYPEVPTDGQCNLGSCNIADFPYVNNPNTYVLQEGSPRARGELESCKIGGNTYYRYKSCYSSYRKSMGACVGKCDLENWMYHSLADWEKYGYSWNDRTKCRIGDDAVIQGRVIGTILFLPEYEWVDDLETGDSYKVYNDQRILILGKGQGLKSWAAGAASAVNITSLPSDIYNSTGALKQISGKYNTSHIKSFMQSQGFNDDHYPAASACWNYASSSCPADWCKKGQWYLGSLAELGYIYNNRYILYNVTGDSNIYLRPSWSSTQGHAHSAWLRGLGDGVYYHWAKTGVAVVFPMLEISINDPEAF